LSKGYIIGFLVLASLFMLPYVAFLSSAGTSHQPFMLFEYGSSGCPHCVPLHEFLLKTYGEEHHVFCDIATNKTCLLYFERYLNERGMPPYVPQTLVFKAGRLTSIVIGEVENKTFWDTLILSPAFSTNITIYSGAHPAAILMLPEDKQKAFIKEVIPPPYSTAILEETNRSVTSTISTSETPNQPNESWSDSLSKATALLLPLALADSVNPCTFALYATLLTSASIAAGRRLMVIAGASFTASVFIGYFILGLLLSLGASLLPYWILSSIAVGYGILIILYALFKKESALCKEDSATCKFVGLFKRFSGSVTVAGSALLGLVASFTLLPCSGGPYLAFASLVSKAPVVSRISLLALYNSIFVTPLIIITAGMLGVYKLGKVQEWLVKAQRPLLIVSGLLLTAVGLYLLSNF
jgi:cytochrome c-type biogenesis protein